MENMDKKPQKSCNIHTQLLAAQKQIGAVGRSADNPYFKSKYADYNSIMEVAKPALNENGLYITHIFVVEQEKYYVKTLVTNEEGDSVECMIPVLSKEQNNPQALGSAITYARRYGLSALLAIETEDDDGNAASKSSKKANPNLGSEKEVNNIMDSGRVEKKAKKEQWETIKSFMRMKGVDTDYLLKINNNIPAAKTTYLQANEIIRKLNELPNVNDNIIREEPVKPDDDFPTIEELEEIFNQSPVKVEEAENPEEDKKPEMATLPL